MGLDITGIIITLITVLFSGGIGSFLTWKLDNRKEDTTEFGTLLNEYKALREKDQQELNLLRERLDRLENIEKDLLLQIQSLQNKLLIFEGSHSDIPLPTWLKDTNGKMIFLNKDYEDTFLLPRGYDIEDYLGKGDESVWEEPIAKVFMKHDKEVILNKKAQRFIEQVTINDTNIWLEVLKYPRMFNHNVIGIGGIMIRKSKSEIFINED